MKLIGILCCRQLTEGRTKTDLLNHYSDIAAIYPQHITQKQLCEICGVCHKAAYNLERRGEILYKIVDTPTGRIHHIRLIDALAYLYRKDKEKRRTSKNLTDCGAEK